MAWEPYRWDHYEMELVDSSLVTVGHLNDAHMLAWDWGTFGYGKATLALHKDSTEAATLLSDEQFYVKIFRNGTQIRDFMVAKHDHGYERDTFNVDEYVKVFLSPLDMFLAQDFCQPENPLETFETPSLAIDDGFKWIVDQVMGPNAYDSFAAANRTRTGLTIAADLGDHPTTQVIDVCHKMNLFEFLQKFGPNWDVDWRLRLEITSGNQNQMVFETFYPRRGLDKSESEFAARAPVIINDASVNVPAARRYRETAGMVNVWVASDESGETADAGSVSSWGRRAALASTSESDKLDSLIANKGIKEGQEYLFNPSEQMQLGDDFEPGDVVTVSNNHLGISATDENIRGAYIEITEGGEEDITLTFGEYEKTLGDKIDSAGGGSGDGDTYWDQIHGLKDDAGLFVPMSADLLQGHINLVTTGASLTIVGTVATNTMTINLATPGTLTVATGNAAAGPHTHAITSSNDVSGGGASILAGDANGDLVLRRLGIGVSSNSLRVSATSLLMFAGTASIILRATTTVLLQSGGANNRWQVTATGHLEPFGAYNIGSAAARAANIYSVLGNFSGDVDVSDLIANGNTVYWGAAKTTSAQLGSQFVFTTAVAQMRFAPGGVETITMRTTDMYSGAATGTVELGLSGNRWQNVWSVAANLTGDLTIGTGVGIIHADGVAVGDLLVADGTRYVPGDITDVATHDHGGNTGSTQPTLSGHTTSWDVAAYGTTTASNPVRDSGGTEVYLRTFGSAADAGNDVNATGEKGYIGSTPHVHHLTGSTGFGSIAATAAVSNHAHTIASAL